MFGSETVPALLFFIAMFFVPSSPRWLALKNKDARASKVLARISKKESAKEALAFIKKAIEKEESGSWRILFSKGIRIVVFAGAALAILSQFTGINAIIYYGPRIMEEAGIKLSDALRGQALIGVVNMAATIFAILTIDRFGRKKLMLGGITGMFL